MPGTLLFTAAELASIPTSGSPWTAAVSAANADAGTPALNNQDSFAGPKVLTTAIVGARTNWASGLGKTYVINKVKAAVGTEKDTGARPLSVGRTLGSFVLAADLADMDPTTQVIGSDGVTRSFAAWCYHMLTFLIGGHPRWTTLENCMLTTYANWAGYCRFSYAACAAYALKHGIAGAAAKLDLVYKAQKQFYGIDQGLTQYAPTIDFDPAWVVGGVFPNSTGARWGINPASGSNTALHGAVFEDASRGGPPPVLTGNPGGLNYPLENLDGSVMAAAVLQHQGKTDVWTGGNNALRRAVARSWVDVNVNTGVWLGYAQLSHIFNQAYGSTFAEIAPTTPSRVIGNADAWTATGSTWLKTTTGGGTVDTPPTISLAISTDVDTLFLDWSASTQGTQPLSHVVIDWPNDSVNQTVNYPATTAQHDYPGGTTGSVTVTLFDTAGLTSSVTRSFTVSGDQPPVAQWTVRAPDGTTTLVGTVPLTVTYDTAGSGDPNGTAITRRIDWGDGTVVDPAPATGSHTYSTFPPEAIGAQITLTAALTVSSNGLTSQPKVANVTLRDNTVAKVYPKVWIIDPDSGLSFTMGGPPEAYTTAERPLATEYAVGHQIFNKTTNKPNLSDGTAWRNPDGSLA